ncbi:MAG: DUF2202 domain-containing protein [Acidimicrobiia bacterium]
MTRNRRTRFAALALVAAMGLGLAACDPGGGGDSSGTGRASGATSAGTASSGSSTSSSVLGAGDRAAVVQMREEEKLARDVYTALGDKWGVAIFDNIAASEQTHMDQVATLLDRYGIADPAATTAPGEFADAKLQALYDQLVAQGSRSLVDALSVGATIEDLDIADLRSFATTTADVQAVWDNLERGSRNHLRAFTSQLETRGGSYTPQYISASDYQAIVTTGTERGGNR